MTETVCVSLCWARYLSSTQDFFPFMSMEGLFQEWNNIFFLSASPLYTTEQFILHKHQSPAEGFMCWSKHSTVPVHILYNYGK